MECFGLGGGMNGSHKAPGGLGQNPRPGMDCRRSDCAAGFRRSHVHVDSELPNLTSGAQRLAIFEA
ncbi:hypothetical protein B0T16DRAFT_136158 [Cercophora newfieldiana]|uniref:Uncharacterized protein n=1 Tax=Cercophora newfieldiana TaxID=92897 RepID=A0AA39YD59_9PEZI|nr:hypothetical protein B0T16DRAFT_136158 [Cercophora newfieldiana]